jgi:hypothetical protein
MTNAAINICVQVLEWVFPFLLGTYMELSGHTGTVSITEISCTISRSYQQCYMRVLISPLPHQHIITSLIIGILVWSSISLF